MARPKQIPVEAFSIALARVAGAGPNVAKAAELRDGFACFKDNWRPRDGPDRGDRRHGGGGGGGSGKPHSNGASMAEKPRIGTRELSVEAIAQKEMLGVLNKLSPSNKDSLISQLRIRETFAPLYMRLLWDACLRCPDYHVLYIEVYDRISKELGVDVMTAQIRALWQPYHENRAWIPTKEILQNAEYDDFCDYVKWKKRALAAIAAWIAFRQHGVIDTILLLEGMMSDADAMILAGKADKTLEVIIEQIGEYIARDSTGREQCEERVRGSWMAAAPNLPPAIRFKIYDLRDAIGAKK